jgi:putative ABC transport system permease protein
MSGYTPGDEPAEQLTRFDAEALLAEARGRKQALMSGGNVAIEPQQAGLVPFYLQARFTSADMFDMFDMPFRPGGGWDKRADDDRGRVAVISSDLNEKLFAGEDSVGRSIRLNQHSFEVVGVLDQWRAVPRFYDLTGDRYGDIEQVFLPFSTAMSLEFSRSGNMDCWGDDGGDSTSLTAPCVWMQFWVELADPGDAAEYERCRELTFRELSRDVTRLAEGLVRLGVEPGDRVALYLPMSPEAAVASHACAHGHAPPRRCNRATRGRSRQRFLHRAP